MQIITTMRSHLTLVRIAIISKLTNKCWWGCGDRGTRVHCCWDCKLGQPLWRIVMDVPQNIKNRTILATFKYPVKYIPIICFMTGTLYLLNSITHFTLPPSTFHLLHLILCIYEIHCCLSFPHQRIYCWFFREKKDGRGEGERMREREMLTWERKTSVSCLPYFPMCPDCRSNLKPLYVP